MRARLALLVLAPLVLTVSACGDDGPSNAADIEGVEWQIDEITGEVAANIDLGGAAVPTLLLEDGTASGDSGCNTFTGVYSIDGDALELGELAVTEMACDDDIMAVESAYLAALGEITVFEQDGELLELTSESTDTVLVYSAGG